jgi:hypothetical protein
MSTLQCGTRKGSGEFLAIMEVMSGTATGLTPLLLTEFHFTCGATMVVISMMMQHLTVCGAVLLCSCMDQLLLVFTCTRHSGNSQHSTNIRLH